MSTSRKQPNRRRTLADYPDVAAQLHPTKNDDLKASDVNPGSHRVVWWLHVAEFGPDHEWQASICHRINGTGCPICNGKTVLAGFNDLATTHPDTADEADGWNVTTVSFGFHKKVTWRCSPYGHTWHAAVCDRTRGTCPNCPYCSGRAVWPGFNDLATTHPDIAAEADEWDATTVSKGSNKKMPWRCSAHGHTWLATVNSRTGQNHNCPYCSGQAVWPGFNDLATTHQFVAGEADGWDATTVSKGSNKKMPWRCSAHGHTWLATVINRAMKKSNCPYCSGNAVLAGFNDLMTTHPDIAAEADEWDTTTVTKGSKKQLPWKCLKHGHKWQAAVGNRTGQEQNCPYCSGNAIWVGFNDLATTHPDIAAEADEWDATTVSAGSGKKMPWRCGKHGHTWRASVAGRTARKHDCPYCSGQAVWPGFNDLATTHPLVAGEADGWDATTVTRGTNKKMPWRCGKHGHTWRAAVRDRTTGRNCPSCNEGGGFNPSKPGYLYLLENVATGLLKVGISNVPKRRFRDHATNGLTPLDVQGPYNDGALAQSWERDILAFLRFNGGQFADQIGLEPFDGYTECWLRESFPVTSLAQLKNLVQDAEAA
jgi:uncharacterized Zn-finger protein